MGNYYDNFEIAEFRVDHGVKSGWVDGWGNIYECRWGQHTELAYMLIEKLGWSEAYWEAEKNNCGENARDWLVRVKKWVLLDCPYGDNKTQVIHYNPLVKHTKSLKNRLFRLFSDEINVFEYIVENIE